MYEEALALAEQVGMLPAQVELHAWLAQLAAYCADWERVEESTEASATLAEREGLVGKLCLPYALRGLLRWREGRIGEATVLFHRAHELAEQVGWSEIAFQALFGLAIALRDQGDLDGATAALDQAIEVCERAGLIAQSIQATGGAGRDPGAGAPAAGGSRGRRDGVTDGGAAALPGRPRGGARGARGGRRGPGGRRRAARGGRGRVEGARPAARGRPRPPAGRTACCAGTTTSAPASCSSRPPTQSEELGVPHLAERHARSPLAASSYTRAERAGYWVGRRRR